MADRSNHRREKRLNIPVSKDEKQQVRVDAAKAGYSSMSEYVRDMLLGRIEESSCIPA